MTKQPFYRVYFESNKEEITQFVESLTYEDSVEEDNMVRLSMFDSVAMALADNDNLVEGENILFQFGYLGGVSSPVHKARITDITHKYADKVTMEVVCLDIGTTIKKAGNDRIWLNMTSSQIAKELATKFSMGFEGEETTKVWKNMPQANRSDLELLQYLAERETGGSYTVFIRNNVLYFTSRNMEGSSQITYTYRDGKGTLLSFRPTSKESSAKAESSETKTYNVDSETGEIKEDKVNAETEESTGTVGKYRLLYGGETGVQVGREEVTKQVTSNTEDNEESKNLANSVKKTATLKTLTASLVVEGEPLLAPNVVITVANVAKRHSGNWYLQKVNHKITQSGYTTTLTAAKNGTDSPVVSKKEAPDPNKTVGDKEVKEKYVVRVYDGETGKFVTKEEK